MTPQEQIDILTKLVRESRDYARRLAVSMHEKFYPENVGWKDEDDMMGLLTQIDNMVTGLSRIVPPRVMTKEERGGSDMDHVATLIGNDVGKDFQKALNEDYAKALRGDAVDWNREHESPKQKCWCHKCNPLTMHMVVCPECGNKRCPKASDHELECTGSNEPGQKGSVYQ